MNYISLILVILVALSCASQRIKKERRVWYLISDPMKFKSVNKWEGATSIKAKPDWKYLQLGPNSRLRIKEKRSVANESEGTVPEPTVWNYTTMPTGDVELSGSGNSSSSNRSRGFFRESNPGSNPGNNDGNNDGSDIKRTSLRRLSTKAILGIATVGTFLILIISVAVGYCVSIKRLERRTRYQVRYAENTPTQSAEVNIRNVLAASDGRASPSDSALSLAQPGPSSEVIAQPLHGDQGQGDLGLTSKDRKELRIKQRSDSTNLQSISEGITNVAFLPSINEEPGTSKYPTSGSLPFGRNLKTYDRRSSKGKLPMKAARVPRKVFVAAAAPVPPEAVAVAAAAPTLAPAAAATAAPTAVAPAAVAAVTAAFAPAAATAAPAAAPEPAPEPAPEQEPAAEQGHISPAQGRGSSTTHSSRSCEASSIPSVD